jgi:UDP-N-acetylmuramate dehydrogenase
VNTGNATANDVIELVKIIRRTVKEKTGTSLEMEVKLVGFEEVMI